MSSRLTFAGHVHELRTRLMWSMLFVAIGAGVGYALNDHIVSLLQQPLGEKLYYTTPTGAFSFIIKVCCVFGFIVSLPVVMYQAFGFFEPLVPARTRRSLVWYVFVSVMLAVAGIAFAYFVSLPAALHFLVNFGGEAGNIQALITAEEYFNFVLAYIAGFAALFQLPLVIIFINKVTPLKPKQLMGGTRYVILGSFIVSAMITPTPDPMNQALMAGPIILLYFVSVLVVATVNAASKRRKRSKPTVPEMLMAGVEELLQESPRLAESPQPKSALNTAMPAATVVRRPVSRPHTAHRPGLVGDMTTTPARKMPVAPTYRARPIQARRVVSRPTAHPSRPVVHMGMISDFITAAE